MQLRMSKKKYGQGGANAPASAKGGENAMSLSKAAAQLLRWSQSGGNNINDLGLSVPTLIRAAKELEKAGLSSEIMGSDDGIEGVVLTAAGEAYKV